MLLSSAPRGIEPGLLRNRERGEGDQPAFAIEYPGAIDMSGPGAAARLFSESPGVTIEAAHRRLVQLTFPELNEYLRDDAVEALAERLGVDAGAIAKSFLKHDEFSPTILTALRKLLLGEPPRDGSAKYAEWRQDAWRSLRGLDREGRLEPMIGCGEGSPALYSALLDRDTVTATGRVLGGLSYAEARGRDYLSLADDAAKEAMFAVVEGGFRLVGFAGPEIVLEVSLKADPGAERTRAERLASEAAGQVLGTIPVPCSGVICDLW